MIASARTEDTRVLFDEWETWFAEKAIELDMRGLKITVRRWRCKVDPDCDEPQRQERDRDAHVSTTFQGTVVMDGIWDPVRGTTVKRVFDDIVEELFKADWAQAKERLGREPLAHELWRTAAQRRADAVVVMAERAHAHGSSAPRLRPLVVVVAGLDALADGLAELWDQTPLTATQLAALLAQDPDIERFVYGSGERPIAYNERARLYTGKLREAIQVRDRHCTGRGCDRAAQYCVPTTVPGPAVASTATPIPDQPGPASSRVAG